MGYFSKEIILGDTTFVTDFSNISSPYDVFIGAFSIIGDCTTPPPANGIIGASTFQVQTTIETAGIVAQGQNTVFKAGESITLETGFHVQTGATFESRIEGCNLPDMALQENPYNRSTVVDLAETSPTISAITALTITPNPTSEQTNLSFNLIQHTAISAKIFNSNGQLIETLVSPQSMNAGHQQFLFNSSNHQTGIYYVVLQTDKETITKRMVVMR